MSSHLLGRCLVFFMATGFLPALLSAGEVGAEQVRARPASELSEEQETELGNFVLGLLEADEGSNNIHQAIEGNIQEIRNNRALTAAAGDRAGAPSGARDRGQGRSRAQGRGRGNAPRPEAQAQGRGRAQGRGSGLGEALRHGLQDRDVPGLGRFVNEQLAQGLRGQQLAAAIKTEITRRKQQR